MTERLRSTNLPVQFPNQDPVKLVRRGILYRSSLGCSFVLVLPQDGAITALRSGR